MLALWSVIDSLSLFISLSSKGDYDAAITQYISTIGKLEPSYVIRKVLIGPICMCVCMYIRVWLCMYLFGKRAKRARLYQG